MLVVGLGGWLVGVIFKGGAATVTATAKAAVGKGTFSSNFRNSFSGPGPMELRLQEGTFGDNDEHKVQHIETRGMFPVSKTISKAAFYTSVLDETDGDPKPVLTPIAQFQEPETVGYFVDREIGSVGPNQYFTDWVAIGFVLPEILNFPGSGNRKLKAVVRLVDVRNPPDIELGFGNSGLWLGTIDFEHFADEKGYEEEEEHRDEARALCLRIAMAVAMADGSLDQTEGEVLKTWVRETIAPFSEEKQKELKDLYNNAMRKAYAEATEGTLTLSESTARLNEIGERKRKLEAVELAYLVMNADGRIERSETDVIRKITESLGLSPEEIEKIRDRQVVSFEGQAVVEGGIEDRLGIDPAWDTDKIRKHLTKEFQRWNGRLNSLAEGAEREQAQNMLDLIGKARKKYDN